MTSQGASEVLRSARQHGYAVGAFNVVNLETAQAVVQAAEAERAPVIVQISENAARYAGLEPLFAIASCLKWAATVPVMLHFDHAESLESGLRAVELGFDSVMLESAELPPSEYAALLRQLSDASHARGGMVEGEFEVVSKGQRTATDLPLEELPDLVTAAGCDAVCVSIGSAHKMTERTATLDLTRLERIAELVEQPLVLHGASGVREDELRQAVVLGISKVNLATGLMDVFTKGARGALAASADNDPRRYLGTARAEMTDRVRSYIRLLGSAGRA